MRAFNFFIVLLLSVSLSIADGETPVPTSPPADTPTPVPTEAPATATPVPPTATPVPPTATSVPSTATPQATEAPAATPTPVQPIVTPVSTPVSTPPSTQPPAATSCPSRLEFSLSSNYLKPGEELKIKAVVFDAGGHSMPNVNVIMRSYKNGNFDAEKTISTGSGAYYEEGSVVPSYSEKTTIEFKAETSASGCSPSFSSASLNVVPTTLPSQPACPQITKPGADFCVNGNIKHKYDEKGCIAGFECEQYDDKGCPKYPEPECTNGYIVGGGTKPGQSCPSQPTCCGNGACDGTENYVNCKSDCTQPVCGDLKCDPGEDGYNCPSDCQRKEACPEGRDTVCGVNGKTYPNACEAKKANVAVKSKGDCVPEGCRGERDENGFFRVICEEQQRCPDTPYGADKPCRDKGGNPVWRTDSRGCNFIDCQFVQESRGQIFKTYESCLSEADMKSIKNKCESAGLPFLVKNAGNNCMIAKCGGEEKACPAIALTEKRRIEEKCASEGLFVVEENDQNGCRFLKCADDCKRDVPKEAYMQCNSKGGELILQRDEQGCVVHDECVRPGEQEVYVDEIMELPKPTELLAMAFKLEDLKIQLDKLAKQTNQIAEYYKSSNSPEEERFRRVSDMFYSGKDKVDEIKEKLRSRIKDLTIDDMVEIRQDIRYIKDVLIRDIVYVMLGSGEEIEEIKEGNIKDCGTDGSCFDRAMRICKPVKFKPEGRNGPDVELRGLEGDKCVMYAILPEDQGPPAGIVPGINPPYEMTCKIPNYSFGIKGPEEIMPYCEGPLLELMKKFGTSGPQQTTQTRTAQRSTRQQPGGGFEEEFGQGEFSGGFEEEFREPGFEEEFGSSQSGFRNVPARQVAPVQPVGGFGQPRPVSGGGFGSSAGGLQPIGQPSGGGFGGGPQPIGGGFGSEGGIGGGGFETGQFGGGF